MHVFTYTCPTSSHVISYTSWDIRVKPGWVFQTFMYTWRLTTKKLSPTTKSIFGAFCIYARCPPYFFTTIQFIFDASLHVFQTSHGSVPILSCHDRGQSRGWDVCWQRRSRWGSDAEQTRQQGTKKKSTGTASQCELIDGDNNVVVTYIRFLESYSFMLATDPLLQTGPAAFDWFISWGSSVGAYPRWQVSHSVAFMKAIWREKI